MGMPASKRAHGLLVARCRCEDAWCKGSGRRLSGHEYACLRARERPCMCVGGSACCAMWVAIARGDVHPTLSRASMHTGPVRSCTAAWTTRLSFESRDAPVIVMAVPAVDPGCCVQASSAGHMPAFPYRVHDPKGRRMHVEQTTFVPSSRLAI